ncbi:MAG: FAD-binding oxidoreductase [Planctomycetes bacterium]|nr:FAD-binding oxidoreductase [Planctomycetota bacterium]
MPYDEIILGQGLAGTTLAWSLLRLGRRILVVDRAVEGTSSRIAAGLMTPITGQRLVQCWRWDLFWKTATEFYESVEQQTGAHFFDRRRMVRLLSNEAEQGYFNLRRKSDFADLVAAPEPPLNPESFDAPLGGFEMLQGGRLQVATFLDVSRQQFTAHGEFIAADLVLGRDIEVTTNGVRLPSLGVEACRLIFCQGYAPDNPWFSHVRFNPAKGEILTLRIPGLAESRIVHRGVWLMPLGDNLFRAGATYEWKNLNSEPTDQGRDEICRRLQEFLRLPVDVVDHSAAVRPIVHHQYPAIGLHAQLPQLGIFNGLGSKGSLQAPWIADHFARCLVGGCELDPAVDLHHYDRLLIMGSGGSKFNFRG